MKYEIDPEIQADPALERAVHWTSGVLHNVVQEGDWTDLMTASWVVCRRDENGQPVFQLRLRDWSGQVEADFTAEDMRNMDLLRRKMGRLWGDLLQIRSHKLIESRGRSGPPDRHLDGSEALDKIIDSVADYSEREGQEPKSLKLPFRYATALMKLGPSYWGDFYPQIRESGLGALDGQTLLGMKIELVPGVDAELQVA